METKILKPSKQTFQFAKNLILNNELVAFPTETVYGLGANASSEISCNKIFQAKGRPQDNPLIVHVGRKKDIPKYVASINEIEKKIIRFFMPGPISIVFPKNKLISNAATCNSPTVAIRLPINKIARKFINICNCPIAAPSANSSKRPSPTCAKHVYDDLNGKIELIIDGGNTNIGIESTVVKVENNMIYILRPGKISKRMLENKIHVPVLDVVKTSAVVESPGTKYTHYCPKCEMILAINDKINNIIKLHEHFKKNNKTVIVFCVKENEMAYKENNIPYVIYGKNSEEVSKHIFALLREYENKVDVILAEYVENGDMVDSLFNRMIKSCSGKTV